MKTTAQHKRDGTYVVARHANRLDDDILAAVPRPPADLFPDAMELWQRIVATLPAEALTEADYASLTACCMWFARMREFDRRIAAGDGNEYKLLIMAATASKQFSMYAAKFGLTPADRCRLRAVGRTDKDDTDPLDVLRQIGAVRDDRAPRQ